MIFGPTSFAATPDIGFRMQLNWVASATPGVNYILDQSLLGDFTDAVNIYIGTGTSFLDERAVIDGKCYYRIKATKDSEFSGYRYAMGNLSIGDSNTGNDLQIFGDSVTAGAGSTGNNNGYAQMLNALFGGGVIGLGGFTITPNPIYNTWNPATGNGQPGWEMPAKAVGDKFCIIAYGLNDCNSAASVLASDYQAALEGFVDYAVASEGWTAPRIIILGPFRGMGTGYASGPGTIDTTRREAFVEAAKQAALTKGAGFISTYEFQVENSIVPPDGLHPNDAQHTAIFEYLAAHLTSTDATLPADQPDFNIVANTANILVAKSTVDFVTAGITGSNTHIIFKVDGDLQSYVPGRLINGISGFEADKGYYIVSKSNLNLSAILAPPL